MTGKFRLVIAFLALACALLSAQTASAAAVSWTVVSSASTITFTTDIGPGFIGVSPQGIGVQGLPSITAHYDGTVSGDITGPMLTISSAVLDAIVTGVWSPLPGGKAGGAPGDYGFLLLGVDDGVFGPGDPIIGTAAARGVFFDTAKAATPVVAGAWDATGTLVAITAGSLDYNIPPFALTGTTPIAGIASPNLPSVGSLVTVGLTETLTIPISLLDSTSLDVSGIPAFVSITGTIVATRTIPEPGTFVMLGLGAAMLVPVAVRRYRRR